MRKFGWILSALISLTLSQTADAQFRWRQGTVLTYQVQHLTTAAEILDNKESKTKTQLDLTKRWKVVDVDATGVATMQLSLLAMRLEVTNPSGGKMLFDSTSAEKSDEHLREQLAKFVGQPLALLRIDSLGRVVEVKESKHGPASRFELEPPFLLNLPAEELKSSLAWERPYKITLEPPQGAGDKFDAIQKYTCTATADGTATIAFTTALQNQPENMLDRVPLLQMQPEGEVVIDTVNGRLLSGTLKIERELKGHQGEGSSYRFQSTYTEKLLDK